MHGLCGFANYIEERESLITLFSYPIAPRPAPTARYAKTALKTTHKEDDARKKKTAAAKVSGGPAQRGASLLGTGAGQSWTERTSVGPRAQTSALDVKPHSQRHSA